jgi:hypothetical protein
MTSVHRNDVTGALFLIYFVLWLLLGIGSTLYVRSRPTVALKRLWWRRSVIGFAVFVWLFIAAFAASSGQVFGALIFAPFMVLIAWLSIRSTYFCDSCGKRCRSANPIKKMAYCPYCGSKLEKT